MRRLPVRSRALVAVVGLSILALGACSGGSGKSKKSTSTKSTPITSSVSLKITGASVESAGPNVAFPADIRTRATQVVNQFVESAVVAPMRTGSAGTGLAALFTPDAVAKLNGPDRTVLTDEGVPKATGDVTSSIANCALTALADTSGKIVLVSAALTLDLHDTVSGGTLRIVHIGDLLLAPDAGPWQIAGYDFSAARSGPGVQASKAPRRAVLPV